MSVDPEASVHPTAEIEEGVQVGARTAIWSHVHMRAASSIGSDCIVGERSYVGPGVVIGDRVKINACVYLPSGVRIEDGVMLSAGAVFTNDRYPRATTPDLAALRPSTMGDEQLETTVREGATVGAGAVIGAGFSIGRFALVGMGSVVTRGVGDFHLVVGNPARPVGFVCRCGRPLVRFAAGSPRDAAELTCPACGHRFAASGGVVGELAPAE